MVAALLLAAAASAAPPPAPAGVPSPLFDDSGIRIMYPPQNLWRDAAGAFTGRLEGGKIILIYDFFDDGPPGGTPTRYFKCPTDQGGSPTASSCGALQAAVADSLGLWADASGRLSFRRAGPGDKVNIWLAWTSELSGDLGKSVDNSRDARRVPPAAAGAIRGFSQPAFPASTKEYSTLLFTDDTCWYVDDAGGCPPDEVLPNGKRIPKGRSIRLLSLHEAGHVIGFGHFTRPSIMEVSGGTEAYELTPYDRQAAKALYDMVAASLPAR